MRITAEELLQRYAAGERDFSGVDLEGADLVRANLAGTGIYAGVNLRGANFARASLREANLAYILVGGCQFGRG
jgi:uncharacterized protein YjbI with pentapeptide repeats